MKKLPFLLLLICITQFCTAQVNSEIGKSAPKNVRKNYKELAHHLCDSLNTDLEKATAIYNWITNNIAYDVKSIHKSKLRQDKPNEVLKRGKTICGGYADLMTAMCKEIGIRAQTIIGYYKDWQFDEGDKFFIPNHAWNTIMISGKWYFVDATAGAGYTSLEPNGFQKFMAKINKKKLYTAKKPKFVRKYSTEEFMPDVETFRIERLAADPLWQLTDTSMPLSVFENGRDAVVDFNQNVSRPKQFAVKLSEISELNWQEQVLECAGRTYAFNPRYTTMLARKKYVTAIEQAGRAIIQPSKLKGRNMLAVAKKELDDTKTIQLNQKKKINEEMMQLKKKNKEKTASFKTFKRKLDRDNKTKNSSWKMKARQAEAVMARTEKRAKKLVRKPLPNTAQIISGIKTMTQTQDAKHPNLVKLVDSVKNRTKHIEQVNQQLKIVSKRIDQLEKENKQIIEQAGGEYDLIDSLLYEETTARYEMHDDFDREVKKPHAQMEVLRFEKLNESLQQFSNNYDTLLKQYKQILTFYKNQEADYKKNFKDIEQYKRMNDKNREILKLYAPQISQAQEIRKDYLANLSNYERRLQSYVKLFGVLQKAHNRQLKYTEYMLIAEEKRNELEAKKIEKDEEWLKAANKKTKQALAQTKKEADKLFKLRHNSNKKKWEKELEKLEAKAKVEE